MAYVVLLMLLLGQPCKIHFNLMAIWVVEFATIQGRLAVNGIIKYPVDVVDYEDREDEEILEDMARALDEGHSVRGVKGPSALINIPYFPLVWGFPSDFMHSNLLGVTRQLAKLWFDSPADSQYYIGSPNNEARINSLLHDMKTPSFVARKPRPISQRKYWKASEWYNWLFMLPCLIGILPNVYYVHMCLLVEGIYLLLQKSISQDEVNRADALLFEFLLECKCCMGT